MDPINYFQNLMKDSRVIVALVLGVSLIIAVAMLSSAIDRFGEHLERASALRATPPISIPSNLNLELSLRDDGRPLRLELVQRNT